MKIKIDSDTLANSIKSLQRLVQAQTVSVEVKKGVFNVTGVGNGNSCLMTVPCTIADKKGEASFSVDANVLLGAISKRKEVELTISESSVVVKASRYEAELMVHQFEAIEVVPKEVRENEGLKLKSKFMAAIRENIPKLELKPLLAMIDHTNFGIKATKEGTFIACWDTFQMAFYQDKELTGKVEFTMPGNIFAMIAREIKDQDYQMSVSDTAIYAFNEMFELAIALPQEDDKNQPGLDNVLALYTDLKGKKKEFTQVKIKLEGIKALLENGKGIYEKDATFTFKVKGNKCQLELKSSFGSVKGAVLLDEAADKDIDFTCDFGFFSSLLDKAPATLDLRVSKEVILFNNKPVTYLLSLV